MWSCATSALKVVYLPSPCNLCTSVSTPMYTLHPHVILVWHRSAVIASTSLEGYCLLIITARVSERMFLNQHDMKRGPTPVLLYYH